MNELPHSVNSIKSPDEQIEHPLETPEDWRQAFDIALPVNPSPMPDAELEGLARRLFVGPAPATEDGEGEGR